MVLVIPMSAARRLALNAPRMSQQSALLVSRRALGDSVRGPPITDYAAQLKLASDFFTKGAICYPEYKAQCCAVRLFAFGGVVFAIVLDMFLRPPKSSYWVTYGPGGWFSYIGGCFNNTSAPLFLTKKQEAGDLDVAAHAAKLVQKEEFGGLAAPAAAKKSPAAAPAAAPVTKKASAPKPAAAAPAEKPAAKEESSDAAAEAALLKRIDSLETRLNEPLIEAGAGKHAAFVFVKPHAVCDKVKYLLELKLRCSGISVVSQGSIAAEKIDKEQLIDTHYGAIAAKAVKLTPDTLTVQQKAQDTFEKTFGMKWADAVKSGKVYNAMDAAEKLGCSTNELGAKWGTLKKDVNLLKFGGGFYCGKVDDIFVINGFYMDMRSKFTTPGTSIYFYEVEWDPKTLSWADFRNEILGGTDPKTAHIDSARHLIYSNWKGLGLKACPDTGDNGVHASASPFEAMSERCNWLGADISKDFYGAAAVASGVPLEMLKAWTDDPPVNFEGKKQSIFDLLEDMNAADCLKKSAEIAKFN